MKKKVLTILLTLVMACTGATLPVQADTNPETIENEDKTTDTSSEATGENRFVLAASGISKSSKGNLVIADRTQNVVRVRTKSGNDQVLAGVQGQSGYKDGSADKARFNAPWDTVSYRGGWLISDSENHVLRWYKGGKVTTLAGSKTAGYKNATGKKAQFYRPTGMAAGPDGEVYIADTGNNVIRKIDKNGKVTTFAGSKKGCADGTLKKARFYEPTGLYYYKGALYVADSGNHRICKIENGKVTTVAGSKKGVEGDKNGSALNARLSNPQDIILYKNVMYISDTGNACVKKLSKGKVTTVVSAFSMGDGREPAEPCGLAIQSGKLYIGDIFTEDLLEVAL